MKYNRITLAVTVALFAGAVTSCSDEWDDHYKTVIQGDGTLWEAIDKDANLSNFKAVLEATGYKTPLNGSQVFTVFAPTDASFSAAQRDSVIQLFREQEAKGLKPNRNAAIQEFVKNHIALYNYSVSATSRDSIVMMNGKYSMLTGAAFANRSFIRSNVQTQNGILFSISEVADYTPNVYEYLGRAAGLDSVASYIYSYSLDVFNDSLSVPGGIVDGKTVYLDSVTTLRNQLLRSWLQASINHEDSLYWMVVPTNQVWTTLLDEYKTYYQYDKAVNGRDSLMYNFPRRAIIEGSAFSRTINPDQAFRDSALSTNSAIFLLREYYWGSSALKYYQFDKPFAEGGIFYGTQETDCSNGKVLTADKWNISKYDTFLRTIIMEGEKRSTLDSVFRVSTRDYSAVSVSPDNPYYNQVSGHYFSVLAPSGNGNFQVVLQAHDVLSNVPYDIYVVAVPAEAADTLVSESQRVPNTFRCTVKYHDLSGKEQSFARTSDFTTVAGKVDSVLIGTYTFPTCSYGLDEAQVKILIEGRVSSSAVNRGEKTKTLRLDCIVLKPRQE